MFRYFTIILCSIAAAIQGWDQEGSNGANLSWPTDFGVGDTAGATPRECYVNPPPGSGQLSCDDRTWLIGFVNSCPYIAIAFL